MYNTGIRNGLSSNLKATEIARKFFLSYPTNVFQNKYEIEFEIRNKISQKFQIPISSIQVAGSAKTGYSYYKKKEFQPGISDLDIAIINEKLFIEYMQISFRTTNHYSDLSKFSNKNVALGIDIYKSFSNYLSRGIFRPDLMPSCREKGEWFRFFNSLSEQFYELFNNINAGIYCNEFFYEHKQSDLVNKFQESILTEGE